jgi:hypothetical protein
MSQKGGTMTEDKKGKSHAPFGTDEISSRLRDAIEGLRKDVTKVEIWAAALGAFARPVPDYRPDTSHDLKAADEAALPVVPGAKKMSDSGV